MMSWFTKILLFYYFYTVINCWDLSNYNITHDNYYVSNIATYRNRAFLSLPRSSCKNDLNNPTLVEVSWLEQHTFFSRKRAFFIESQTWDNCEHLQNIIAIDVEVMRARLWALDKGSNNCPAKIVIYNLFQKINYTLDVPEDVPRENLTSVIVDPYVTSTGSRAYIGLSGLDYLLVFSFNEFKWWKLNLEALENLLPVASTQFLALSRKESVLYITGAEEQEIYSLNLKEIRRSLKDDSETINVTWLGEKLGPSNALITDLKDGLMYYLTRDYAIVRWDTRNPSEAEYYNILAQSYEILPYVSQLFTGPQNGVWALVNPGSPNECGDEVNSVTTNRRLVKILKFNTFI